MSTPTIRAALERLVRMLESPRNEYEYYDAMIAARAALAAAPEGEPSDQEIADVFSQGCRDLSRSYEPPFLGGARAVFARWGRSAAQHADGGVPRIGHILRLAEIIREVDGKHDKGAAALAEAILSHPEVRSAGLAAAPPAPLEGEGE